MAKYYGKMEGSSCIITVPITQEIVGNFLHVTRESVSATLKKLSTQGHISMSKKILKITDLAKLEASL
jgi:CRP-like cAMP-binding protein